MRDGARRLSRAPPYPNNRSTLGIAWSKYDASSRIDVGTQYLSGLCFSRENRLCQRRAQPALDDAPQLARSLNRIVGFGGVRFECRTGDLQHAAPLRPA